MQRENRRLAAIVAADIAGYSRLIGQDEEGTLRALRAHRAELIDPLVEQHGGRIANTAGDSLLLEFPSAVEAVRCCIAVQEGMAERNSDIEPDSRIAFRVGINVGDVVAQGDDLLGDGVNVAARLEGLAEPGSICLSHTVHDQIRDRMDLNLEDMGEIEVKNIARPVRVFRVLAKDEAAPMPAPVGAPWRRYAAGAVVILAIVAGAGAWWWQQRPDFKPAEQARSADKQQDKPSIAVLPFANISGDAEQDYFSDGMTDDLITDLSKISALIVMSRNSVFRYKGKNVKIQDIARDLEVDYVLEGSIRRDAGQVRINAQLIDGKSGAHLWAETFDRDYKDIFKLQDEVTGKIAEAMKATLTPEEVAAVAKPPTTDLEAYEYFLQAEELRLTDYSGTQFGPLEYYEDALAKDPNFVAALVGKATWARRLARGQFPAAIYVELAEKSLTKALSLAPNDPVARRLRIYTLVDAIRHDEALALAQSAILEQPQSAMLWQALAQVQMTMGQYDNGRAAALRSLSHGADRDPELLTELARYFMLLRDYERAIILAKRALKLGASPYSASLILMASYIALGQADKAEPQYEILGRQWPWANTAWLRVHGAEYLDRQRYEEYLALLNKAGIPEYRLNFVKPAQEYRVRGAKLAALISEKRNVFYDEGSPIVELLEDAFQRDDLLCVKSDYSLMDRPMCEPVYRNPDGTAEQHNEYIWLNGLRLGPIYFSLPPKN